MYVYIHNHGAMIFHWWQQRMVGSRRSAIAENYKLARKPISLMGHDFPSTASSNEASYKSVELHVGSRDNIDTTSYT